MLLTDHLCLKIKKCILNILFFTFTFDILLIIQIYLFTIYFLKKICGSLKILGIFSMWASFFFVAEFSIMHHQSLN